VPQQPPPLLRCGLDQEGSFKATRTHEIIPEPAPREYFLATEESIVSNLETEGFKL